VTEDKETRQLNSELRMHANLGGSHAHVHLVSDENDRFGIYVETGDTHGGAVLGWLEPEVPLEVAVSLFITLSWSQPAGGTERVAEVLKSILPDEDQPNEGIIIP
jgi:hypothetical protein